MLSTNQVQDTVNQSMTSAIPLFHSIALMNNDHNLHRVFFNPEKGIAIAGHRRQVANFGTMLVKGEYGPNNEVHTGGNMYEKVCGSYDYIKKVYIETNEGLPGEEIADGVREKVNAEKAIEKIDAVRREVEGRFEVGLSPNAMYQFFENRKKAIGEFPFRDKKINMQFTEGLPVNTMIATAEVFNDEVVMISKIPKKGGSVQIHCYVDRNSRIELKNIQLGREYLIQPVIFDKKEGIRTCNVLRTYKKGIRMAVQNFKNGLIKPGDKAYDVNPDPSNGIFAQTVFDAPFLKGQNPKRIAGAPMMTFDLDMIYSLMKTLSGYPVVRMQFKDSSTGVYFRADGSEFLPQIEAIVGPTIQYVRGRIWLP